VRADHGGAGRVICSRSRAGVDTFRIVAESPARYVIWGREGGSYRLCTEAREARGHVGALTRGQWERFLIGQVLPFASLLAGLEIFHASAVALHGGTIAITGASGAGKTSLALALCGLGAGFVTDDVLALECSGDRLFAHSGPPLANVARAPLAPPSSVAERSSPVIDGDEKQVLRVVRAGGERLPLSALFFLDRTVGGPSEPRFEAIEDPRQLLGSTFNFALATSSRLRGLLEVCALASRLRVERIVVGSSIEAERLGRAVIERVRSHGRSP
jgi:hypothetical protein